ncbi:acyl-protein thioesterase 1 homolog 1 isoform X5 [Capsicum annuum]|uniref:acyl-protein thioesterase 1 homolog 1 isoform X5 n=1 Tax=Capsicum annuum TaxID=4072 RepID=UPI001FB13C23|nr:acyl-protein thioesterase 1 homolog 1 isoform X5 [Capsicum annuum]
MLHRNGLPGALFNRCKCDTKFYFLGGIAMSFNDSTAGSGTTRTPLQFGRTHVVRPRGKHEATIIWLHGLGDNGSSWSQLLESLPLPNVKWICPTAPTRPIAAFGGFPCTAWDISENAPDDLEGLDFSAAHVANLLSTEPADVKLCVGGFSMGAATALYSATCHAFRQYGNGSPYRVNLSAVVGLSGWLPCARTLRHRMEGVDDAGRRAASLPILLCHGTGDDVIAYQHGEKSARILSSSGFWNLTLRTYEGLGHYTIPEETDEICRWLSANLCLGGT